MKLSYLVVGLCCVSVLSTAHAEILDASIKAQIPTSASTALSSTNTTAQITYKALTGVKTNMQRMMRSQDGQYFLHLHAGVWNPTAQLSFLNVEREIHFDGLQKGNQLNLNSLASDIGNETAGEYLLSGMLNADQGDFKARLKQRGQGEAANVIFEPAFKVVDKPTFVFKYYANAQSSQNNIERIDVLDKKTQKVVQRLTGFSANNKQVNYIDVNFDGYYDLVLKDGNIASDPNEQRYIYWMYNPKTQRYQRSAVMEKLTGYTRLNGAKQQVDFGGGRVYQVTNGLLNAVKD